MARIQISEWSRTNLKPSFQSESIQMNPKSERFGLILIENSVWINRSLNWSDWKLVFGLVRIHLNCCLGLNRISSDRLFTVFYQTRYKTFFGLVRIDSHWLGYRYRNSSDWLGMNFYPILSPGKKRLILLGFHCITLCFKRFIYKSLHLRYWKVYKLGI